MKTTGPARMWTTCSQGVRRIVRAVGVPAVSLGGLLMLGCHGIPSPPDDHRLLEVFPPAAQGSGAVSGQAAASDLDIYVDGSASMQGFLASDHDIFRDVLNHVLVDATSSQFRLSVFRFTSDVQRVQKNPLTAVQQANFYGGRDTPLAALLRRMQATPQHAAILVSDLVQSEHGSDSQDLVQALTQLATLRPQIRLLAYRSDFRGTYYPESGRRGSLPLNMSQNVRNHGRPFYLLVVAPDEASMRRLQDDLISRTPVLESYDPTAPAFAINDAEVTTGTKQRQSWVKYSSFKHVGLGGVRFENAYTVPAGGNRDTVEFPVTLATHAEVPLTRATGIDVAAQRTNWNKNSFAPVNTVDVPIITGNFAKTTGAEPGRMDLNLVLSVRNPPPGTWDVYRMQVRPHEGSLGLPSWVDQWSADDDSVAENGNKTFQLHLLVETMENVITQHELCGDWLLKLGGGS